MTASRVAPEMRQVCRTVESFAVYSVEFADTKIRVRNANQVFAKDDPKNFIPPKGIRRIAATLTGWKEEDKLSRIVDYAELKKNDCNISPSRYIHTSDAETYRPIAEIVEELNAIETEARGADKALKEIWGRIGV